MARKFINSSTILSLHFLICTNYKELALTITDVFREKDDKEWRDEIVDSLDITASRMPDSPDKQKTLK